MHIQYIWFVCCIFRHSHQNHSRQLDDGSVRRTAASADYESTEYSQRHRPPERPDVSAHQVQETRDHGVDRWVLSRLSAC